MVKFSPAPPPPPPSTLAVEFYFGTELPHLSPTYFNRPIQYLPPAETLPSPGAPKVHIAAAAAELQGSAVSNVLVTLLLVAVSGTGVAAALEKLPCQQRSKQAGEGLMKEKDAFEMTEAGLEAPI
jgi:hypothetical protein